MPVWFWFLVALVGWALVSFVIGTVVGRMFRQELEEFEPERDWQWPRRVA